MPLSSDRCWTSFVPGTASATFTGRPHTSKVTELELGAPPAVTTRFPFSMTPGPSTTRSEEGTMSVLPRVTYSPMTFTAKTWPALAPYSIGWVMSGEPGTLIGLDAISPGAEQVMFRFRSPPSWAVIVNPIVPVL